ncbi:acyl-CoA dehydrogenase family protein [Futiania mangrovi]|uniref:Acyl-CoA/acyl-ACP dehydrogenase n=1 Tax=Futiania mangrovi TaxID=2959716 RepID=A0A9J6PL39_9PROT|nr:acyl-CoA dehydrogenase family protein [Futiania mangrovii]MCP1336770.1 acyl-CoA/acyl-ACP dehydrogenase [Futiania mangrovii]
MSSQTIDHAELRDAILKICADFGDKYWMSHDESGDFPEEFHQAIAAGGWLGIAMPEEYGGSNLGITEAAIMMQAIAESGAAMSGASAIHMNIFGLTPVVRYGTEEQRQRFLPPLIAGKEKACFAVTEPNAGLNTTSLTTRAVRDGDHYVLTGQKMWISTAQVADKMLILARTTPREQVSKPTEGISLFYTDLDRSKIEVREIHKMGRAAVDSNALFIDGLRVPKEDLIGEEGKGFYYILHGMNPERILLGAESVGVGFAAVKRASQYAREREVFGRPIGMNQGIQHPLARCWMELEAARLLVMEAARRFDADLDCGAQANAAKFLGAEAGFKACETAILTHGGMGYSKEYQIERWFREVMIPRIAPVSRELVHCYIAERVLGLPKSY